MLLHHYVHLNVQSTIGPLFSNNISMTTDDYYLVYYYLYVLACAI